MQKTTTGRIQYVAASLLLTIPLLACERKLPDSLELAQKSIPVESSPHEAVHEAIKVSLSVSEKFVAVSGAVTLRGAVTTETGTQVSNAPVTFIISRPGGTTTLTVNTDASGIAEWNYKASLEGSYSVSVKASSGGAVDSSGPLIFIANGKRAQGPAA